MNPPTPIARLLPGSVRAGLVVPALSLLACLASLATSCGPSPLEKARAKLEQPIIALADSGDVEVLRVIADIEVLRADGMFSDSLANALTAMPASEFFAVDDKGVRARAGRGVDLTTLIAYTAAEPMLLKEMVVTPEQAAELRRMAVDNMKAAAEMAAAFAGPAP